MPPANLDHNPPSPVSDIYNWLMSPNNSGRVQAAMQAPGGWEKWLQLPLFNEFRANIAPGNVVARERRNIWAQSPNDIIDFWFTHPNGNIGVELKCRTADEESYDFVYRYLGDMTRCAQAPGLLPTTLYAVGVASSITDLNGYHDMDEPSFMPLQDGTGTWGYLLWRRYDHH